MFCSRKTVSCFLLGTLGLLWSVLLTLIFLKALGKHPVLYTVIFEHPADALRPLRMLLLVFTLTMLAILSYFFSISVASDVPTAQKKAV